MIASSSVMISGCHSKVVVPGLSAFLIQFSTMASRPTHGFANGSVK